MSSVERDAAAGGTRVDANSGNRISRTVRIGVINDVIGEYANRRVRLVDGQSTGDVCHVVRWSQSGTGNRIVADIGGLSCSGRACNCATVSARIHSAQDVI